MWPIYVINSVDNTKLPSQLVSQSVSQSVSQLVSQSVNHSVSQLVSQSVSQSASQSVSQSVSQSAIQSVSQLVHSSAVNQSLSISQSSYSQSVNHSVISHSVSLVVIHFKLDSFHHLFLSYEMVFSLRCCCLGICLACGDDRVFTEHPLFEGGLCKECKVPQTF